MVFWIIIPLLTILAVAFVVVPLLRANGAAETSPSASSWSRQHIAWLVLGLAALMTIPAIGLYAFIGRPDLAAVEARGDAAGRSQAAGSGTPASSMSDMIVQLQDKVRQNPKDAESWQTLGWAFMHIRQPKDAAEAYRQAVSLAPDKAEYRSALAEASIQSGDGKISDEAVTQLRRVTAADPADARARFYLALYKDQQGDHRGAIADWITLLKSAPAGAVWAPEVRRVIVQVAKEQKLDVSAELPAVSESPASSFVGSTSGPSAEQVAAARQMSSADQSAMIHGMVDRLAGQLKQNPHDAEGWMRLMRARMVLGEKDQALAAYHAARNAFAKEPQQLTTLENQARALGVTGG
jgi:cytochrome c-type biogenesis protein CcmH